MGQLQDDDGRSLVASPSAALVRSPRLIDLTGARLDEPHTLDEVSALPQDAQDDPPEQVAVVVADLAVAGRYVPAGAGGEPVAGDFYDVLRAGRDRLVIVVADVTGHGPTAAARMRALRTATRAVALAGVRPRDALATLDTFLNGTDDEGLATLWYGQYRPSTGALTYASAGHPPPVLSCHGDPTRLLEIADAPPLGTGIAHALAVEHTLDLPLGALLVAYSDGLVERHDADLAEQLALLQQLVAMHSDPALAGSAQQIADAVLDALIPDPAQAKDDVCLMVVRRQPDRPDGSLDRCRLGGQEVW